MMAKPTIDLTKEKKATKDIQAILVDARDKLLAIVERELLPETLNGARAMAMRLAQGMTAQIDMELTHVQRSLEGPQEAAPAAPPTPGSTSPTPSA